MMNNRARGFRGLLIKAPLHFNIIAIFIAIFIALTGSLVWYNYSRNAELALDAADSLLQNVSEKVVERTRNFVDPPVGLIRLAANLPTLASQPGDADNPVAQYFLEALSAYPQLYGLFVGYGDGGFFQVVQFAGVDAATLKLIGAPADAAYGIRNIKGKQDGTREQAWTFLGQDRKVLGRPLVETASYDPRTRPWYSAALRQDQVSVTDAYIFSSLRAPGLTVSRRISGGGEAVVAADITLARLSSFLREQKVGESGIVFIHNDRGEVIAYPDANRTVKTVTENGKELLRPVQVRELDRPDLTEALLQLHGSEDKRLVFSVDSEEYIASVSSLHGALGADKKVAIVVPINDFIGPIAEHRFRSLLYSVVPLFIAIALIMVVSEWIARPIRAVVQETQKIRQLVFEGSPEIDSRITEIRQLAESVSAMKAAIRTFAQYVPKALVERLIKSGNVEGLGGERRQLSIMFSDVANFTDLSEDMSPEDLMLKTSHYFQELGEIILANQGSIDKFIGDAIMAFWNAPLDDADHVTHACRTVLLCRLRSQQLNDEWAARNEALMHTRFGLHTGDTVVGNIGSPDRMDYTALGVSVNLAARLEGLNKRYGTQILVSESVAHAAQDAFLFRPIDVAAVKGLSRRVIVYELCAALEGQSSIRATDRQVEMCRRWAAIYAVCADADWMTAEEMLQEFVSDFPDDPVARHYLDRCKRHLDREAAEEGPPARVAIRE
jgi:adenylate cyclase